MVLLHPSGGYQDLRWNCEVICKLEYKKFKVALVHVNMEFLAIITQHAEPLKGFTLVSTDMNSIHKRFQFVDNLGNYEHDKIKAHKYNRYE
jgi:hypothetical protein